ncbi:phosphoglycolate phosphatase [Ramlibacter sp. USB13]|uniref:Phosphoglycolate phosphatase n=1 Tax=Ramlibacter cellulosilyticus TaxID=2764187 RepID=A0A923MVP5_9BURK|nr:phosphoglycolate phosphatase [Ramlibacter cellulosilyticus]MBC5785519.1 phosphoglycolate phosphatase [Ramlibacter cellulosilyticus]
MPLSFRSPPQAAIIDLDGTLVDTLGDFTAALDAMAGELRLPAVSSQVVKGFIGKGSEHLIRSVLAHVGAPASLYGRAWDAYQSAYRGLNGRFAEVYPGVVDGVRSLRAAGLRLACLTNKPGEFARDLLEAKGLAPCFELVFGGDAFERKKPDPLPLVKTCEALGTAPAATLMVGDSRNDAAAARAAGCQVVLVTYGYNHGEPVRAVDADAFIDSLAELGPLLRT